MPVALPYPNIYFPGLHYMQSDNFIALRHYYCIILHFVRLKELGLFGPEKRQMRETWGLSSNN